MIEEAQNLRWIPDIESPAHQKLTTATVRWIARFSLLLLAASVLSGCGSIIGVAYRQLDWLTVDSIEEHIPLTDKQRSMLRLEFSAMLRWHCESQIPRYAEWLASVRRDLRQPELPPERIAQWTDAIVNFWAAVASRAAVSLTPVARTLTSEQLSGLEDSLRADREKFEDREGSENPEKERIKNSERMTEHLDYWVGELTDEQHAAIDEWSTRLVPIKQARKEENLARHAALVEILRDHLEDPSLQERLARWLSFPRSDWTPDYSERFRSNALETFDWLAKFYASLSERQLEHFDARVKQWRVDIKALRCSPPGAQHTAPAA